MCVGGGDWGGCVGTVKAKFPGICYIVGTIYRYLCSPLGLEVRFRPKVRVKYVFVSRRVKVL